MSEIGLDYYKRFEILGLESKGGLLPEKGEGTTMASQIVTAVSKLIYKWYNDGDVYDNCWGVDGFGNDLSSHANWLYEYVPESEEVLERIHECRTVAEYESILKDLADSLLCKDTIDEYLKRDKVGSIYDCDGVFEVIDIIESDDEEEYY